MKNQSEISIADVWPDHEKKNREGLKRQESFLFNLYSAPLHCPSCGQRHTGNELKVNHPDYIQGKMCDFDTYACPVNGTKLKYQVPLIGENFLSLAEPA